MPSKALKYKNVEGKDSDYIDPYSGVKTNRVKKRGTIGNAEFNNAKRTDMKTGGSSSKIPTKSNWGYNSMSTHSEPARQSRLGKKQTASGPKKRGK